MFQCINAESVHCQLAIQSQISGVTFKLVRQHPFCRLVDFRDHTAMLAIAARHTISAPHNGICTLFACYSILDRQKCAAFRPAPALFSFSLSFLLSHCLTFHTVRRFISLIARRYDILALHNRIHVSFARHSINAVNIVPHFLPRRLPFHFPHCSRCRTATLCTPSTASTTFNFTITGQCHRFSTIQTPVCRRYWDA